MPGKIDISSGTEDLSTHLFGGENIDASSEALMGFFLPVGADEAQVLASVEGLTEEQLKVKAAGEGGECQCCAKRPPLASKVVDANGNAYITILYDGSQLTGGGDTGMFTGLIDAASENDIVDVTIMTSFFSFSKPNSNIFAALSLLSALQRTKAKVITRTGCLCSLPDCALWLSGKERKMSPMGWLVVRQPTVGGGGTLKDVEFRVEDLKDQMKVFVDFIVEKGLLTTEEIDRMYDEQSIIGLSYDELDARIKSLKD